MNKKGKIILVTIAALSVATFLLYRNNKKRYAQIIIAGNASGQPAFDLMTFGEGYLQAWAQSVKKANPYFQYQGQRYNTKGGKSA